MHRLGQPAAVEPQHERAVDLLLALRAGGSQWRAGDEHADRAQVVVVPVLLAHLAPRGVQPGQVLRTALDRGAPLEPVPLAQRRVVAAQSQRGLGDLVDVEPGVLGGPVDPGGLVVLAVGVVVAALGTPALVARGDHRHAVGQAQGRHHVGRLPTAYGDEGRVVGLALDPVVPRAVVVGAVAVVLAVGLVVLVLVGHEVAQGEAVVGRDEVDGVVGRPPVVGVEVRGAGEPGGDGARPRGVVAPEVADLVAVLVVPLHPRRRHATDEVAVHRGVPRLGDQLHVPQDRVLADGDQQVGAHVDVVAGAGQRRHQVEAEAVDVHLGDPVAQRVEDEPQRQRVVGVDGVAAAGDVPVGVVELHGAGLGVRLGDDALVEAAVVEPPEGERRAQRAGLRGVVVDHVEDHLEARAVQRLDHLLELADLLAAVAGGGVRRVRGEVADGVVAPVVAGAALGQAGLGDELVDREQLDRGDAEVAQVVGDRGGAEAGVRAAQVLGDAVVQLGHALDVALVDDRVAPAAPHRLVALPVEVPGRGVDHDAARHEGGGVLGGLLLGASEDVAESGRRGGEVAADRHRVGVQEQLVRVEPVAGGRVPRPVDAVAVAGAGLHVGQGAVPDAEALLGEDVAVLLLAAVGGVGEQAERHLGGRGGVDGEVGPLGRPRRAQRPVAPGPDPGGLPEMRPRHRHHAEDCVRGGTMLGADVAVAASPSPLPGSGVGRGEGEVDG